jgi:hypothetical protein
MWSIISLMLIVVQSLMNIDAIMVVVNSIIIFVDNENISFDASLAI